MLQHVCNLVRCEHEVDWHQHRTHARDGEAERRERMRIARKYRNAIADTDANAEQTMRKRIAHGIELAIRPLHVPAHDRDFGGKARRRPSKQIA